MLPLINLSEYIPFFTSYIHNTTLTISSTILSLLTCPNLSIEVAGTKFDTLVAVKYLTLTWSSFTDTTNHDESHYSNPIIQFGCH